jgi:LmbE family N-acetylglucosaminyl deacetylase
VIPLLDARRVERVLCLGAHCDDIEIGAGGTVMRLVAENPGIEFHWVIFGGADPSRADEARRAAALFTQGARRIEVIIHGFRDAFLPWEGAAVKEAFERLKRSCAPDLILTHHDDDRHQDHRLISELTWNTWRDHAILEYEIFKWDGDLGRPNVFVPLDEALCRKKAAHLTEAFASQRSRQWFSEDVFLALARLRGVECNAPSRYAEAFYARKLVL